MAVQHVFDEALREPRVGRDLRGRLPVRQDHVVHHRQRGHQLRASALSQQRLGWIRDFHHQQLSRCYKLTKQADVLGEQRIEMS